MSLSNNPPLAILDLNIDVLFEIFDHINLLDLLELRLQCSTLNIAICKYLPKISKLSIVYTEHSSEKIPSKNLLKDKQFKKDRIDGDTFFDHSNWLNRGIADFARESTWQNDLIVIFGRLKFQKFLEFINKFEIHNIKKLSLIVDLDPCHIVTLSQATEMLKLCPSLKTLFLQRAHRGQFIHRDGIVRISFLSVFKAEDLESLLDTITELASLSELHFFSNQISRNGIFLTHPNNMEPSISKVQINQMFANFLSVMFQKLRVFGFHHFVRPKRPIEPPTPQAHVTTLVEQNFENILKLGFHAKDFIALVNSGTKFNNLRSLTLFDSEDYLDLSDFNVKNSLRKLTTLRFAWILYITDSVMHHLNSLPCLETLSAESLSLIEQRFNSRDLEDHNIPGNRIKHIEVEWVYQRLTDKHDVSFVYPLTYFFPALETVTVSPPGRDKVVYDINTLKDIRIRS